MTDKGTYFSPSDKILSGKQRGGGGVGVEADFMGVRISNTKKKKRDKLSLSEG